MKTNMFILLCTGFFIFAGYSSLYAQNGFTQQDRELLIELKIKIHEMDNRFEQVDKRFEQVDKRFEQVDKRFEEQFNFLWIITGIFTAIMVAAISFAYWDRRTIIDHSVHKSFEKNEKEGSYLKLLNAMRQLATTNTEVAQVLRQYNLL